MALKDIFKGSFKKNRQMQYANFLNGFSPVFSQFGQNIYVSDVVQMCIDIIATEISKLQPKHIRTDNNEMQSVPKSSVNRLFKFAPNPLMTTRDFLEKIIWQLYMNNNAFIYPIYTQTQDAQGNNLVNYTGFYPLNPNTVVFQQDMTGVLFVELHFNNSERYTIPYSDIIHLRKKFSVNDVMGGGANGQPDNTALLKVLEINDTVLQGIGKAVKTSLSIKVVSKINTMLDDEKQQAERKRLETAITNGDSAILTTDLKSELTPLNIDPKIIDKGTLQFLQDKVLNWYGVSVPIFTGDFTDEQYQAFYEKTLEPILISLGQAFSKCIFSTRELDVGNEIIFYQKSMMFLSTKSKLELLKTAGEQGLLMDNQKLAILGYPPIEGGNRRTMSLNYIDVSLANAYQLKQAGKAANKGKGNKEEDN